MINEISENVKDFSHYSINETCKILNIHRNTLRKYTDLQFIKVEFSKCNGKKFYFGKEIKKFFNAKM